MLSTLLIATLGAATTVDVFLVRLEDTEPCEESCWKALEHKVRGRPGVKKTAIEEGAVRATVAAKGMKPEKLIAGLDGFKMEMRAGYSGAEVRIEPDAFFPPMVRPEVGMVVLPVGPEVQAAVEQAVDFKLQPRMKCVGKVSTRDSGELFLSRFVAEGAPPDTYVPFAAMPDFDGDGKYDLYLRLEGMPEIVVLGKPGALRAVGLGQRNPDEIVRCDVNPERFVRVVSRQKVRCATVKEKPAGDAVERVVWNQSAELLFYDGKKFVTCRPASSGEEGVKEGFGDVGKARVKLHKGARAE